MEWSYRYTPYLWPMLAWVALSTGLAWYGWHRRAVKSAPEFSMLMVFSALWAMGATLGLTAANLFTKEFWFNFQFFWLGPIAVAGLCFVLEFAGLGRLLNQRYRIPLLIFLAAGSLLILTNASHQWVWQGLSSGGDLHPVPGRGFWILVAIGYLLSLLTLPALVWLFFRSPQHRWPVTFIFSGHLAILAAFLLDLFYLDLSAPISATDMAFAFASATYAVALFGFGVFDPVPVARKTLIEQMQDGMLVLDAGHKIVDLNPAAARVLGIPMAQAQGRSAAELLPAYVEANAGMDGGGTGRADLSRGTGADARFYMLNVSLLTDRSDQTLGQLVLLHDVTEQKRAQAQLVEQQSALAALREREHLARELHDELSQELAFINVQAQAAHALLRAGQVEQASAGLDRLAGVAREAQVDVRGQISKLSLSIPAEDGFVGALQRTIVNFNQMYGMGVELILPEGQPAISLLPCAEVGLLRIVQEALTNVRKHARAKRVRVAIAAQPGGVVVEVEDDGAGFDPHKLAGDGRRYGLRIMTERAEEIGGSMQISSAPGSGTRVIVCVPAAPDWSRA